MTVGQTHRQSLLMGLRKCTCDSAVWPRGQAHDRAAVQQRGVFVQPLDVCGAVACSLCVEGTEVR
eukprot:28224-Chlamydomonas_euryale.AAC.12